MSDYDDIQKALTYLDPHEREFWVEIGAALKDELGESGFELWDSWSQQAQSYKAADAKAVWKSLKPGHIRINTLFYHARQSGWRPDKPYTPPSAEERAQREAAAKERQRQEAQERSAAQNKAKATAQSLWKNARPAAADHPYLKNKGIDPQSIGGIRQNTYKGRANLLVPVYLDKTLVNLQSIDPEGGKRFLAGGQVKGGYTVVGDFNRPEQGIVMAEGFATAASIHQATGLPVVVAFNAGNMVTVAEHLAQRLPEHIPVVIAVDNDASQTGMNKATAAAAHLGSRAVAIEPVFSMAQIQQYQRATGLDSDGNPRLPSDFNDLHRLAGLEAVRERIESERNRMAAAQAREPQQELHEPQPESHEPQQTRTAWGDFPPVISNGRLKELSNEPEHPAATPPTTATSSQDVAFLMDEQESPMSNPTSPTAEPNSIEYAGQRRNVDYTEADFKRYELYDPTTDILYLRHTPEQIQQDLNGKVPFYFGITHDDERVQFHQTEQGWEAPAKAPFRQPEASVSEPQVSEQRPSSAEPLPTEPPPPPKRAQTEPPPLPEPQPTTDRPSLSAGQPVLDLDYERPPEAIKSRYVVAGGRYISAENARTVLFEDKGKSLHTAKTDAQTIEDMLTVAQSKGWDSIKLSGTKEFKAMMYVAAESRGIRTRGYSPTPADKALLERVRSERALNTIEAAPSRQAERATPPVEAAQPPQSGRIAAHGRAPYQHDPKQQLSYYLTLEHNGKEHTVWGVELEDAVKKSGVQVGDHIRLQSLGRQELTLETPVYDQNNKVTGHEHKATHRNLFQIDRLDQQADNPAQTPAEAGRRTGPDTAMLAEAETLKAQSAGPDVAQINASPVADTSETAKIDSMGAKSIPPEVIRRTEHMKGDALDAGLVSAKAVYHDKAQKLSKPQQAKLAFYERNTLDAIRGLEGDARSHALRNYYEYTAGRMKGSRLDLPDPLQVPKQEKTHGQQAAPEQQTGKAVGTRTQEQEPEMER